MIMRFSLLCLLASAPGAFGFSPRSVSDPTSTTLNAMFFNKKNAPVPVPAESPVPQVPQQSVEHHAEKVDKGFRMVGMVFGSGVALAAAGPLLSAVGSGLATVGIPIVGLAALLGMRTASLELEMDETHFGFTKMNKNNRVIGGKNRWAFDKVINYEFFPKGWIDEAQGPLLFYFKEVQTPPDKWTNVPESLNDGAGPGQVHLMPALFDCKRLRAEFEKRGVRKLSSDDSASINLEVIKSLEAKIQSLESQIAANTTPKQSNTLADFVLQQEDKPTGVLSQQEDVSLPVATTLNADFPPALEVENLQQMIQKTLDEEARQAPVAAAAAAATAKESAQEANTRTLHILDYPKQGSCGEMQVPKQIAFLAKTFGGGKYLDGECSIDGYSVDEGTMNGTKKRDKDKTYQIYGQ